MWSPKTNTRAVLITGASSGIGAAIARAAGTIGWHVFVGYATGKDRANRIVEQIVANKGTSQPLSLPLTNIPQMLDSIEQLATEQIFLDTLILCASPPPKPSSFVKTDLTDYRRQLEVSVIGNHALITSVWKKFFRRQAGGHVIALLSSALGPPPTPNLVSYVVAKSALFCLLQCACAELGKGGFRATAICPGYTDTPMLRCFSNLYLQMARSRARAQRFLTADEVASVVLGVMQDPPEAGELVQLPVLEPSEK